MFNWDRPLSLNPTFAYIMSIWEIEISESDFYFFDDNFAKMMTFFLNMRLCNNLRGFMKKFDFNLGSVPAEMGEKEEDLNEIYAFLNSDKVDSKLVPNMPSKVKLYLQKTRWHMQFNKLDFEDLDYYERARNKKFVYLVSCQIVELDHFFICSRNSRKGSIMYPFSYEIKMDIGIERLVVKHKQSDKKMVEIEKMTWDVLLKVSKRKGVRYHDRSFSNSLQIESAQIYLTPSSLLFYKFITFIQVIYGNFNYSYYKEAMMNYLRAVRKREGNNLPFIDSDLLMKTIERHSDSRLSSL